MKLKIIFAFIIGVIALAACGTDDAPDNLEPELTVGEATDITRNEATLTGYISLKGSTGMPELRIAYGTSEATDSQSETLSPDNGTVKVRLTGLKPGTTYYYRLVSDNGRTTLRSDVAKFITTPNQPPTFGEVTLLSHGPLSMIVSYMITDNGGNPITENGYYITEQGGDETKVVLKSSAVNGIYKVRIGELKNNTTYTIRPFATNVNGEAVGEAITHTTGDAVVLGSAGDLNLLIDNGFADRTMLSLAGPMNGDDFSCIKQLSKLQIINLADAYITEGGGTYDGEHFTKTNTVGNGMFAQCTQLVSLVLPESATVIEKDAFNGCKKLSSITLPTAAVSVTPSLGLTALERIEVPLSNTSFKSIDGVLFSANGSNLLWFPLGKQGDYTLPDNITALGDYAFEGCRIKRFTFNDNLTSLGVSAFHHSSLESVTLPPKLTTVPYATFQQCGALTTVVLGETTGYISDFVFDGCPLKELHIKAATPPYCKENAFGSDPTDVFSTCTVFVPKGSIKMYINDKTWKKFTKIVEE